jgi:hypothetical protein
MGIYEISSPLQYSSLIGFVSPKLAIPQSCDNGLSEMQYG